MLKERLNKLERVRIKNIYFMLAYIFDFPIRAAMENLDADKFNSLYDLLAKLMSVYMGELVKRGLYREYINKCDDMAVLQGKINMQGTIKNRIAHKSLLSCEYDDLSENILLNQILKTTANVLLCDEQVNSACKQELRKTMRSFSGVDIIECSSIAWSKVTFHRNNRIYRSLIKICEFIIKRKLLSHNPGRNRLERVENDTLALSEIFERFVAAYYKKEWGSSLMVEAQKQLDWFQSGGGNSDVLPKMRLDLMLVNKKAREKILIIDTKFYDEESIMESRYGKFKIRPANLYQIFAYVKNKAAEDEAYKVSGMLLYASAYKKYALQDGTVVTDLDKLSDLTGIKDEPQPDEQLEILNNRIDVRTLNLYQDFSGIRNDLDWIVKDILGVEKVAG